MAEHGFDFEKLISSKSERELGVMLHDLWLKSTIQIPEDVSAFLKDYQTTDPVLVALIGLLLVRGGNGSEPRDPAILARLFLGLEAGADSGFQDECKRHFTGLDLRTWFDDCVKIYWEDSLDEADFFYFQKIFGKYGELELPASVQEFIEMAGL